MTARAPGWDPRRSLEECGAALGIPASTWPEQERIGSIEAPPGQEVDASRIAGAAPALVSFVREFGTSLHAAPPADDVEPVPARLVWADTLILLLEPGLTAGDVTTFLERLREVADGDFDKLKVTLFLSIHKRDLLRGRLGADLPVAPPFQLELFLYAETLVELLHQPTTDLELWWRPSGKLVLCAPAWDGFLDGPHLALVGGDPLVRQAEFVRSAAPDAPRIQACRAAAREHLKWERVWMEHLTPLHFELRGAAPAGDPVSVALCTHLVNLALLFTADYNHTVDGQVVSTYRGSERRADVDWLSSAGSDAGAIHLLKLVEWVYSEGPISDRLTCLQNAVARQLAQVTRRDAGPRMLERVADIRAEAEWQMKAVMDRTHGDFTAQVRAIEEYATAVVQTFAERVAAMVESLSQAMLAAVAAVLGSFGASLLDARGGPRLLQAGVLLYVVYLFVFPFLYSMTQRFLAFRVLDAEIQDRRALFEERLPPERVAALMGKQLTQARRHFLRSFVITAILYAVVAGLLFTAIPWPGWAMPFLARLAAAAPAP